MSISDDDNPKGAYNKALVLKGEIYTYWISIIYVHFLSNDKNLSCVVIERPFTPNGADAILKHPKDWDDTRTKKVSYDLKARNILIFALSAKVFYSISHHKSGKGMWDVLQTLYEET